MDNDDARVQRLEAQLEGVMNSLATSQREVERLRTGRFTPEEFQNLCHGFDENDKEVFVAGCLEYQRKLFGPATATAAPVEQSEHVHNYRTVEGQSVPECKCGAIYPYDRDEIEHIRARAYNLIQFSADVYIHDVRRLLCMFITDEGAR